jgi:hypothetical protein
MSLAQLTNPASVKLALAECDRLGREEFLRKYGFRPARRYLVIFEGRKYDSKAVAGVAHSYQFPNLGPLTAAMFSGGVAKTGAACRLRELGFHIDSVGH